MHDNYQVMARRWRPQRFSELVGQKPIVQTLKNAIQLNRIAHAFLFIGPRGTGKTSTARLLAMALNAPDHSNIEADPTLEPCRSIFEGNCLDVIEIDGASNNSVEQIRSLREECQYTPTICRFKIYIIDEVHMLSQAAFNALLKTLEEPPGHVKFIFATTEAYKIPATIASRCQRFEFKPIAESVIAEKLSQIAQTENIEADPLALQAIARIAEGGMRDAQSILDQLTAFGRNTITERDVTEAYGLASSQEMSEIFRCVEEADFQGTVQLVKKLEHCNAINILSDIARVIRTKLYTINDEEKIARNLKFLEIVIYAKNAATENNTPEIMLQLALFQAIEAFSTRSIDQIISILRNVRNTTHESHIGENNSPREDIDNNKEYVAFEAQSIQNLASLENSCAAFFEGNSKENKIQEENIGDLKDLPEPVRDKLKDLFRIES